jgi:hypothetical protein
MALNLTPAKRYLFFLGILAIVAITISAVTGFPLGFCALIFFIGWPVICKLITLDDDLPGGWSNPDGKSVPEWRTRLWHVDILLCRGSIVLAAFAFQNRQDSRQALTLSFFALVAAAFGFPYVFRALRAFNAGIAP